MDKDDKPAAGKDISGGKLSDYMSFWFTKNNRNSIAQATTGIYMFRTLTTDSGKSLKGSTRTGSLVV